MSRFGEWGIKHLGWTFRFEMLLRWSIMKVLIVPILELEEMRQRSNLPGVI